MSNDSEPTLDELKRRHPDWSIIYEAATGRYIAEPLWDVRHRIGTRTATTTSELETKIRFTDRTNDE